MALENNSLLGASNEDDWDREGHFNSVDALSKAKTGKKQLLAHLLPTFTSLPELTPLGCTKNYLTGLVRHNIEESLKQFDVEMNVFSPVSPSVVNLDTSILKPGISKRRRSCRSTTGSSSAKPLRRYEILKAFRHRNPTRAWNPKKARRRLVIGMDVGLKETYQLSLCALVGRFAYKSKCSLSFTDWMKDVWNPIIGYVPTYLKLPCG